jgi:hypothetical protein
MAFFSLPTNPTKPAISAIILKLEGSSLRNSFHSQNLIDPESSAKGKNQKEGNTFAY